MIIYKSKIWQELKSHKKKIQTQDNHLTKLLLNKKRNSALIFETKKLSCDFTRQRINKTTISLLLKLAKKTNANKKFLSMYDGEKVNITEKRAALHTALRIFNKKKILKDGNTNITEQIKNTRDTIKIFSKKIHSGKIKTDNGKKFSDIIVVGIGGSHLGCEFCAKALSTFSQKNIEIHFLSNIDNHHFEEIKKAIDIKTSLWIIISKSYQTSETLLNEKKILNLLKKNKINSKKHIVSISAKGKLSKQQTKERLAVFDILDSIGGRYSTSSAVGGIPLSLYLSYENFEELLKGAEEMDNYILNTPIEKNAVLFSALIDIWNTEFLGYQAKAMLPYPYALKEFVPHMCQLVMESLGKAFDNNGKKLEKNTGYILFGDSGLNAQHSFMQMAHQGRAFPIDFIGIEKNNDNNFNDIQKNMEANMLAQAQTLAEGDAKYFEGNRPSSIIRLKNISPKSIGALLSFYEAQIVFYAFILNINPFDQFGVELAKTNALKIKEKWGKLIF